MLIKNHRSWAQWDTLLTQHSGYTVRDPVTKTPNNNTCKDSHYPLARPTKNNNYSNTQHQRQETICIWHAPVESETGTPRAHASTPESVFLYVQQSTLRSESIPEYLGMATTAARALNQSHLSHNQQKTTCDTVVSQNAIQKLNK